MLLFARLARLRLHAPEFAVACMTGFMLPLALAIVGNCTLAFALVSALTFALAFAVVHAAALDLPRAFKLSCYTSVGVIPHVVRV